MLKFRRMLGALPFLSTGPDPATMTIAGSSAISSSDDDIGRVRSPCNWHDGSEEGNVTSDLLLVSSITFVMFLMFYTSMLTRFFGLYIISMLVFYGISWRAPRSV
mmetsp:Transcript_35928/g.77477  ORF Transcript_35928/g.77477 Transcript_35928/m.77477 type:complete len:105 (+) Transcript_35928:55-369(+)